MFHPILFIAIVPLALTYLLTTSLMAATYTFFTNETIINEIKLGYEIDSTMIAIVTGSNTGLGYETAKELTRRGFTTIIACRNEEKGKTAAMNINSSFQQCELSSADCSTSSIGRAVFISPVDLSSFESVRSFAKTISAQFPKITLLVNNAVMNGDSNNIDLNKQNNDQTKDGSFDLTFKVNFLSHFLLTNLLLPNLLHNKTFSRVVNLSSVTHHFSPPYTNNWHDAGRLRDPITTTSYMSSKLAMTLFTQGLNFRYGADSLRSIAVNPGAVNSDIWRNSPDFIRNNIFAKIYLTNLQGSTTSVAAAIGEIEEGVSYLHPYWEPFAADASVTNPLVEMLGVFAGVTKGKFRSPSDQSAEYLYEYALETTKSKPQLDQN